jgi:hypothetical protein
MHVCHAPHPYLDLPKPHVFLAGSIEMGRAEPWQDSLAHDLRDHHGTLLNPRRPDWDSSWQQSPDDPRFLEQVQWELQALEDSDLVVMYLDPDTRSPISLLELGLYARSLKLTVCCPPGFWRRGNVQIVCSRYHVPLVRSLDDLRLSILSLPLP